MPATPTPRRSGAAGRRVERLGRGARVAPARAQRLEARLEARRRRRRPGPVTVGSPASQRIEDAELERVEAERSREFVVELLLRERALRHAEAAEGAGGNEMGVHRARDGAIVRHAIGAGGVHRHAIGDGRAPGGIGAGVEIGGKIHRRQPPVARRADFGADARGMALGRRHASIRRGCRPCAPGGRASRRRAR